MKNQQEAFTVFEETGEKKYFTQLPNYILDNLKGSDFIVYCHLKRLAGEHGVAFPSITTLVTRTKLDRNTVKRCLNYLTLNRFITNAGKFDTLTAGGYQKITSYKIVDIWKLNVDFYHDLKGGENTVPLEDKGGLNDSQRGVKILTKGGENTTTKKNHIIITNNNNYVVEKEVVEEVVSVPETTPKEINKDFFEKGEEYTRLLNLFAKDNDVKRLEPEFLKFWLYWTERTPSGKKEKWEAEKTFEVKRRLYTWLSRKNFKSPSEQVNKYKVQVNLKNNGK